MKTKIVLWGENAKDEKILLGIELLESDNLIRIHTIPEKDATEVFYNQMMNQWREGQEIVMPDSVTNVDRALSMTEGLLPDDIKTDRQDILARAKTEWHFVILSSKLYEAYADEVGQIKERVDELTDFDGAIWEEMKTFWKKVQNQVQEKNLFREHAAELRTKTNELFDSLKSLKRAMNDEFEKASKEHVDKFYKRLEDIEERIEKGLGLQPIFNELKNVQHSFKDTKFTRKHHNDVWKRLDEAFKKVKEKRFGSQAPGSNSAVTRLTRRFDGLLSAIEKMERSIDRDKKDRQFQIKRIDTTDGQLELQIRQAKMAMIDERIKSKQVKLDDMLKTKGELESRIESEKAKAAKLEQKREEAKKIKEAKKSAKENIAKEIEAKSESFKGEEEKLTKAAAAIAATKKKREAKAQAAATPPIAVTSKPAAKKEEIIAQVEDEPKAETTSSVEDEVITEDKPVAASVKTETVTSTPEIVVETGQQEDVVEPSMTKDVETEANTVTSTEVSDDPVSDVSPKEDIITDVREDKAEKVTPPEEVETVPDIASDARSNGAEATKTDTQEEEDVTPPEVVETEIDVATDATSGVSEIRAEVEEMTTHEEEE